MLVRARQSLRMRDASRRLCEIWLHVLAGGPTSAIIAGIGCLVAAIILLGQGNAGPGVGLAVLSAWCAVGYRIAKRCRRVLGQPGSHRT